MGMKKFCIIFVFLLIIMVTATGCHIGETGNSSLRETEYFRIHIRADSNDTDDQKVKYFVKEAIVEVLTPVLCACEDKQSAMDALRGNLSLIKETADRVLRRYGFSYSASASVKKEDFPVRVYEGVTLPAGEYDSLIVNLGSGEGDNWWCVIYPPLCFTGGKNVVYRSKIKEIIENFLSRREP